MDDKSILDFYYSKLSDEDFYYLLTKKIALLDTTSQEVFNSNRGVLPNVSYYECRFGKSWNDLIEGLSVGINKTPVEVNETNDELIEMYIQYSNRIGKPASQKDLDEGYKLGLIYGSWVFKLRFGSTLNLKRICGFEETDSKSLDMYSIDEIKKNIVKLYEKYGAVPQRKYNFYRSEFNLPSRNTLLKYFKVTRLSLVWQYCKTQIELNK